MREGLKLKASITSMRWLNASAGAGLREQLGNNRFPSRRITFRQTRNDNRDHRGSHDGKPNFDNLSNLTGGLLHWARTVPSAAGGIPSSQFSRTLEGMNHATA